MTNKKVFTDQILSANDDNQFEEFFFDINSSSTGKAKHKYYSIFASESINDSSRIPVSQATAAKHCSNSSVRGGSFMKKKKPVTYTLWCAYRPVDEGETCYAIAESFEELCIMTQSDPDDIMIHLDANDGLFAKVEIKDFA